MLLLKDILSGAIAFLSATSTLGTNRVTAPSHQPSTKNSSSTSQQLLSQQPPALWPFSWLGVRGSKPTRAPVRSAPHCDPLALCQPFSAPPPSCVFCRGTTNQPQAYCNGRTCLSPWSGWCHVTSCSERSHSDTWWLGVGLSCPVQIHEVSGAVVKFLDFTPSSCTSPSCQAVLALNSTMWLG